MPRPAFGAPSHPTGQLLATGRFVGEGFDDRWLDTLFLAMPIAWRGTLQQYAGVSLVRLAQHSEERLDAIHTFCWSGPSATRDHDMPHVST